MVRVRVDILVMGFARNHGGIVKLPGARRHDDRCDDYQKAVDGFWASSANSRHATNRAASCLR